MGTSRQTPEFKRQRFQWLEQVLADPLLPASCFKVAYRISDGFNDVRSDGRCWEACESIATAVGMSKATVITMVRRLHANGHLRVEWGRQGRGHPNNYWPLLKGQPTDLSSEIKGQPADLSTVKGQPADLSDEIKGQFSTVKGQFSTVKGQPADLNQGTNQGRAISEPLGSAAAAASGGSLGVAPSAGCEGGEGEEDRNAARQPEREEGRSAANLLDTLRGVWARPFHHTTDNRPAGVQAQQRALDAALQGGARFEDIVDAARRWTAAFDLEREDRRYLPSLENWLGAKSWLKPPPKRARAKKGSSPQPPDKPNPYFERAGVERGADGVLREKGRVH